MKYEHFVLFGNEEEGTGREHAGQGCTLCLQLAALTVRLKVLVMDRKKEQRPALNQCSSSRTVLNEYVERN